MPEKMFPHFKLLCWLYMGPTLGFNTQQRNSFLIKFGLLYQNKILTILFMLNMRKSRFNEKFLVLLGPTISRLFACSNEEKINQNNKACSSPISASLLSSFTSLMKMKFMKRNSVALYLTLLTIQQTKNILIHFYLILNLDIPGKS